jgi:hypothetical protein
MATVYTSMQTARNTREIGRKTSSTARDMRLGQTAASSEDFMSTRRKKEKESTHGLTETSTSDHGRTTPSQERASIFGTTGEFMPVLGKIT